MTGNGFWLEIQLWMGGLGRWCLDDVFYALNLRLDINADLRSTFRKLNNGSSSSSLLPLL